MAGRYTALAAALVALAMATAQGGEPAKKPEPAKLIETALHQMTRARVRAIGQLAVLEVAELRRHKVVEVLLERIAVPKGARLRVRTAAIEALGDICRGPLPEAKLAVEPDLTRMLKNASEAPLVRRRCAEALGGMLKADVVGDISAIRAIESIAADTRQDKVLRKACIAALGRIGHPGSVKVLKKLLARDDYDLVGCIARAWKDWLKVNSTDIITVRRLLKLASDKLLPVEARLDLLEAVGQGASGERFKTVAPELIDMLEADDDQRIHCRIIEALALIGDLKALPALLGAYKAHPGKDGTEARALVCEALGEFYGKADRKAAGAITELLIDALYVKADPSAAVRAAAAFSLSGAEQPRNRRKAIAALIESLADKSPQVAADALGSLKVLTDVDHGVEIDPWRKWYRSKHG